MKPSATPFLRTTVLTLLFGLTLAAAAQAYPLRSPQVVIYNGTLQAYLNSVGQAINVYTDQLYVPFFDHTSSNTSTFTLMIELAGNAPVDELGLYNASDPNPTPTLFQIFPGAATAGWFATATFYPSGDLIVNLFDNTATLQGNVHYAGVDGTKFGFYVKNPGGTFFTDDARNLGGWAQALVFAGTGTDVGQFWLCWEDTFIPNADHDYDDAIIFLESVNPVPTRATTWGDIKARYR
jgi:hypothetical protein